MEKIIRNAKESDIPAMKLLWLECFPADVEYSKFFFDRIFRLPCARVCEIGGVCVAMIHVFPYDFATPDGILHAKYIYGVGTTGAFRGRGIAGEMLESEAHSCDFTVIIPQSISLFDFYERYGYTELFSVSKTVTEGKGDETLHRATEKDIPRINEMYEAMCKDIVHPIRSEERWKTIMAEFEFLGGGISLSETGYCVHYEYEGKTEICELCGNAADLFGKGCTATVPGESIRLGLARLISSRAKEIFSKGYGKYMNLMHN
ncbi:MAG: GNAT family N-acetyltransferase [Oscillospiraceae bacterium]|nr:GNAT family N-acetyltransferase [Oscillospiraceae bacterium]